MPELPEVETTLRGISPHLLHQKVMEVIIRHPSLRWPIPDDLPSLLKNQTVLELSRRAKYLLLTFKTGTLILHLGMSGRIAVLSSPPSPKKHDHVDIVFSNKMTLRFTDPRRFGAILWTSEKTDEHSLLKNIGPEPLSEAFNAMHLFTHSRKRKIPVKSFIMDAKIVAGVGNIYAAESLFKAGIRPQKAAGKVTLTQYEKLVIAIKKILAHAITKGGTTLKDFMHPSGTPGYFSIALQVYGKAGKPCPACNNILKSAIIGQRSSVYCPYCQH